MAGTGLGAYASIEINDYKTRQKSEVHQEITQAAQSNDAKGVSQTHYAREQSPGLFSKPREAESLIKPIKSNDIIEKMDQCEVGLYSRAANWLI